jgi:hypothetical protein|eukprot:COSAG06_NODE_1583_length_9016_cov_1.856342_4_plen_171_part_00
MIEQRTRKLERELEQLVVRIYLKRCASVRARTRVCCVCRVCCVGNMCVGALDASEVGRLCQRLGIAMGQADVAAAMDDMDRDGNGEVEFEEFSLWYSDKMAIGEGGLDSFARALEARRHAIGRANRGLHAKRTLITGARHVGRAATIAERAAADARATNAMRARGASAVS